MRHGAISIFLLLCGGCENGDVAGSAAAALVPGAPDQLMNRVWTPADSAGLPGSMRIFLSDGTLVQDSCWETHRLSLWRMDAPGAVVWNEDSSLIRAEILLLSERELVLRLHLVGGSEEQRYVAAAVPYLCPDVPR